MCLCVLFLVFSGINYLNHNQCKDAIKIHNNCACSITQLVVREYLDADVGFISEKFYDQLENEQTDEQSAHDEQNRPEEGRLATVRMASMGQSVDGRGRRKFIQNLSSRLSTLLLLHSCLHRSLSPFGTSNSGTRCQTN